MFKRKITALFSQKQINAVYITRNILILATKPHFHTISVRKKEAPFSSTTHQVPPQTDGPGKHKKGKVYYAI